MPWQGQDGCAPPPHTSHVPAQDPARGRISSVHFHFTGTNREGGGRIWEYGECPDRYCCGVGERGEGGGPALNGVCQGTCPFGGILFGNGLVGILLTIDRYLVSSSIVDDLTRFNDRINEITEKQNQDKEGRFDEENCICLRRWHRRNVKTIGLRPITMERKFAVFNLCKLGVIRFMFLKRKMSWLLLSNWPT